MLRSSKVIWQLLAVGAATIVAAEPAAAQNYDAALQVRVGAFLQWANVPGDATNLTTAAREDFSFRSRGLGATAGLEWINKSAFSWGVEIDGAVMSGKQRILTNEFGTDYLATLRLRGGRHLRPDLFLYGTVGIGALGVNSRLTATATKVSDTVPGLVIGGGLEWDFGAGLLFGEYLYGRFGTATASTQLEQFSFEPELHAVRFGVKFKVGHDHYYDDVAKRIGRSN
jgi:opacity protein-like surface antigen